MNFPALLTKIQSVQSALQSAAAHAVNTALTVRNWLIGYYIVEFEQNGEDRAQYGQKLLKNLEQRLQTKGMTERRFREFRRMYLVFPQIGEEILNVLSPETIQRLVDVNLDTEIRRIPSAELENQKCRTVSGESNLPIRRMPSAEFQMIDNKKDTIKIPAKLLLKKLPYSHLNKISQIENPTKRAFYVVESAKGVWSYPELERQINSLYYERSGMSKNKKLLSELANFNALQLSPRDVINTPIALEFLQLSDRALVTENDLEQAILDHLQAFLLEMGRGFCFEARQKRILIDDEYFL
jgi:predicted nuclease of restriction endonuclease-like (RecB) superfamily